MRMSDPYTTRVRVRGHAGVMTQGVSQVSERYRRLAAEFTRRVEAVPAGRWESPSPCAGWTARDVLRHIIDVHRSMPGYAGLTVELRKSAAEDPVGAWLEARDAMQEILEDPARARLEYDGYFGRTTLEQTVDRFLCFDLLIHAWDIARATGGDETLPLDEVRRVHAEAVGFGDALRGEQLFGPPVSVPEDASEQDKLIAFLGRTP